MDRAMRRIFLYEKGLGERLKEEPEDDTINTKISDDIKCNLAYRKNVIERNSAMSTTMENIIDMYETTFGKAIVVIPAKTYTVGDEIYTENGKYKIKSIIQSTKPEGADRITFIVD